jgi:hypothetical protein
VSPDVRAELRTGVFVIGGCVLAALVVGLLWWALAPVPRVVTRAAGIFLVGGETEVAVAADGWFAACSATAGLVAALVVFARMRRARLGPLLGLVAGGLIGAVVAWRLGVLLGPGDPQETAKGLAAGTQFDGPLKLSARGVLFAWPLVSTVAYFALTAGLEPAAVGDAGQAGRRFPVTVLRPGYSISEVDEAFSRFEEGQLTPAELHDVRFPSSRWRQGYDGTSVDAAVAAEHATLNRPVEGDGWAPPSPR